MRDDRTHPLLAQVPLTVSPFVNLPVAATLPYTYKPMPSTLPPPSTGVTGTAASSEESSEAAVAAATGSATSLPPTNKPAYVISGSGGHSAHPTDIIASCQALMAHVTKLKEDADREMAELDRRIRDAELAEKRRVAPGWLDSEARLLEPERPRGAAAAASGGGDVMLGSISGDGVSPATVSGIGEPPQQVLTGQFAQMSVADREGACEMAVDEGAALDRAFGGMP